jgi:hypothetical protein
LNIIDIRASSFPTFLDCPDRWVALQVEGMKLPTYGPSHLGTSLHHAAGQFDLSYLQGDPITPDDAVDLAVDMIKSTDANVVWAKDLRQKDAIDLAVPLTLSYCNDIAMNETFEEVELKCEPLTISMENGVSIRLTGQVDRVRSRTVNSIAPDGPPVIQRGISDLKSGRGVISNGEIAVEKHIAQLGTYELIEILAEKKTGDHMVLPAQVIAMPTSGTDRRVIAGEVDRPSKVLLGDGKRKGLLETVAVMAKNEVWPGNPRSMLCGEKYCPRYHKCFWRGK